jgi:hypothetical protein
MNEINERKLRVDLNVNSTENSRMVRGKVEGAGDGRMSVDDLVPVCRTPRGCRVPGLLIITRARKPTG